MALLVTDARRGGIARLDDWDATNADWLIPVNPGSAAGVAPTPDGFVFADPVLHRVVAWDGSSWQTFGTQGSGQNQFERPQGVAADGAGRIYVADSGNARIVRIDGIDGSGWMEFGQRITSAADLQVAGYFAEPTGVAVASDDSLTIADLKGARLVSVSGIDGSGWSAFGIGGPAGVANDSPSVGVAVFGTGAAAVVDIAAASVESSAAGALALPVAVAWLSGELVCCDALGPRLVRFEHAAGALNAVSERRLDALGIYAASGVGVA